MVLERIEGSHRFQNYETKLMAIAFPFAFLFTIIPFVIGFFIPQIASVYIINAYIIVFLTIFGVCLALLGFHNTVAKRLVLIIAITSFLGALAHYWLLIENLFFGLPITYPNISGYIAAGANIVMLVGLALVSFEQRRRSRRQIVGYLLIILLFAVCILSVYQLNLTFHPPIFPAFGSGLRILAAFFTAIFAWTFYFNQNPPREVIGRISRLLLVGASLILILGYTVFAYQYAMGWMNVASFYYAGSISDSITLMAIFTFLIAVLAVFSETLENMVDSRPMSIKYEMITRILLIVSLIIVMTLTSTIAITLTGRVLLVFLAPIDALLALQTIGTGLLMGFATIVLVVSGVGIFLSRWLYRPLELLEEETASVTDPGIISYTEPKGLVFTELQGVSDSFAELMKEISRVRAELRRFTITERRQRTPSTSQLAKLDYYLAILNNSVTSRIQTILTLSEIGRNTSNAEEQTHVFDMIQTEINEIEYTLKSIQLLRLIDTQALPEFSRLDLGPIMTRLITDLQELIPESANQISLALPETKAFILANTYVAHIFQPLLRLALERDVGGPAIIEVSFSKVEEYGNNFWQIDISHPKWVLPEIEKVLLFRADSEQPQKANPSLLLVPALVDYFRGKFRVKNIVIDDPQYGTVLQVLLPEASSRRVRTAPTDKERPRS